MTTGPGPHTDDDTVVAIAIQSLIEANKADLQLEDVLYGNHTMIPRSSAAVVVAGGKSRALAGAASPGGRTVNSLNVIIEVHWSKVGDEETQRKNVDNLALNLERLLHADTTLGGIIIHGFVQQVDRGDSQLANNSMFRSVRLLYTAVSKTYLTPSP